MARTALDPGDREPLYVQLAEIIRGQIKSGELASRRPIPSKRSLTEQYEISARTVDSAIDLLRADHLIETRIGRGLFVVPEDERGG